MNYRHATNWEATVIAIVAEDAPRPVTEWGVWEIVDGRRVWLVPHEFRLPPGKLLDNCKWLWMQVELEFNLFKKENHA